MRDILKNGVVTIGGIVTTLLTVVLNAAIYSGTGMNLFGFSLWFIVPVGAIICGGGAALGYYLAASYFHRPPTRSLLWQMVLIAAVAQVLIYWTEYRLTLDAVPALRGMSFWTYLDATFTTSRLVVRAAIESPEMGGFGYVFALIQFAGFLVGGLFVFTQLEDQPGCAACGTYFRTLHVKRDAFPDDEAFGAYYDHEFDHPVDSPEFAAHVGKTHSSRNQAGMFRLKTDILGCPSCHAQAVTQIVSYWGARGIQPEDGLSRVIPIPPGIDVVPAYRGERT